jgi:predicted GNAT superfamily acetyltransferase
MPRPSTTAEQTPTSRPAPAVEIRAFASHDDYAACVALQRETWGATFSEHVPPAILKVTQRIGGVSAGAFDASGRLVGFVFGMTGVEHGRLVHWSDMLAVRPEYRDAGLGRRLKQYQRDVLLPLGVEVIYWTYDPLVARNAHLNINRLGAQVTEYVEDMYGADTDSVLHRGIGSDRFVVAWPIGGRALAEAPPAVTLDPGDAERTPLFNPDAPRRRPKPSAVPVARVARVEIPADIGAVQEASLEVAAAWRADTRATLTGALAAGYRVAGFVRTRAERCYYLLARA